MATFTPTTETELSDPCSAKLPLIVAFGMLLAPAIDPLIAKAPLTDPVIEDVADSD